MSASTMSVTANPAAAARRRPVLSSEKKSNLDFLTNDNQVNGTVGESGGTTRDLVRGSDAVAEKSSSDLAQAVMKSVSAVTATATTQRRTRKAAAVSKPEKPRWKRVMRIFMKNFLALLLLVGMIHLVRKAVMDSAKVQDSPSSDLEMDRMFSSLEERVAEVDGFLKSTAKMMQVQVELLDKKIDGEARGLRETIEDTVKSFEIGIKDVESRNERLEKSITELTSQNWVTKEELEKIYQDLKKEKEGKSADVDVNLDEVRAFAREIVEKAIANHAADGLGRVDYALGSSGAFVVKHSEPYLNGKGGNWFNINSRNEVHGKAAKMLSPSFGEPGQCFPLKGSNGYVQIRLRTAIVPEAITLEHVSKSVAYDRSSAPKDCRVSGWLQGQDMESIIESEKMFLLTEFTYDLDKTNAQTYNIPDSARSGLLVDTIRLDFTSNHGSPSHTCIYRFRVHGHEPDPVLMMPTHP